MNPAPRLTVVDGGCDWEWVSDAARAEAEALLDASSPGDRADVYALIELAERGKLRPGKDFKESKSVPGVCELRVDTTRPRLRLYFGERLVGTRAVAVGLLLAVKPRGTPEEQRAAQNRDFERAGERLRSWNP